MPFESGPPGGSLDGARSTRPLGRGLEDISHLFSASKETSAHARVEDPAPERPVGRPSVRSGVAVLRPSAGLAKDQLTATLLECQDALENGMRALAAAVSCSPYGEIDLLVLDRFNRLTVVDVETTLGDALLLRGMSHVSWVSRNVTNAQRMYQSVTIDSSQQPRLVLVAPGFSPILRSAARQLACPLTCFKYHAVAISSGTGILIEHLRDEDD